MTPATAHLPRPAADALEGSIAAANQIGARAGAHGPALIDRAQHAFVNGLSTALVAGACVLFAAAVIVAALAPGREQVERAQTGRRPRGEAVLHRYS